MDMTEWNKYFKYRICIEHNIFIYNGQLNPAKKQ